MEKRGAAPPAAGGLGRLFLDFLKFGCFTFGGGWSIVAQMQALYVERQKILTAEELLDLTSVSRSIPGVMVANVAMMFGCRMAGLAGGIVCVLGLALPPLVLLSVLTFCYTAVRDNPWVMAAMTGVRAAVVPIMISAVTGMVKGAFRVPPCLAVTAVSFALYLFLDVSCVWLVLLGAACGLLISEYLLRKGEKLP